MKKNNIPWLSYALTGSGIGFPVTVICALSIGGWNHEVLELLVWMVASILFGVTSGLFFEKLNLKLITATALHFICCLVIAATAGTVIGYSDSFLTTLTGMLPLFAAVYVIVYLFIYIGMRWEAERINKALEQE